MLKKLLTATTLVVITTISVRAGRHLCWLYRRRHHSDQRIHKNRVEKRKGIKVIEVSMIKYGPSWEGTGFAKLKIPLFGETIETTKSCSATKDLTSNQYIWQCE